MQPIPKLPDQGQPSRFSPFPAPDGNIQKGSALIIILAFVVLMTGLVMAFFSRAMGDRQVANSSANQTKTELFAEGALDTIVGDLEQEIAALSGTTVIQTGAVTTTLYTPNASANAVPALVGSTGTSGLENLVKISQSNSPFYTTGTSRAAALSTNSISLNGRSISRDRWNKPLLLAKKTPSGTAVTPVDAFPTPDWILVSRNGTNPTTSGTSTLSDTLKWSQTADTAVVGRYAYAIYNEGGLLDVNVAGYPSGMTASQAGYKEAVAFADMTQLGLIQSDIDALVGWRNYATTQVSGTFPGFSFTAVSGTNYQNYIRSNTTGFLSSGNPLLHNGQSDRMFSSRQQLISFCTALGQTNARQADLQNALQYLTTFSRSLNQPSYSPDPNRPKIIGPAYDASPANYNSYSGGNDAYSAGGNTQDLVNPAFQSIRVSGTFQRNDGSTAAIGEPLVKKRFALNRLCWLTCKGPSANLASSDVLYQQYIANGISPQLLSEGSVQNIQKYFGLSWTSGPGQDGIGGYWTYEHGFSKAIATLNALPGAKREPDFFELLKGGVCAGSLAKGAFSSGMYLNYPVQQFYLAQNTLVDNQIMQIGANIIDQASPDGYPTRILFDNGTGIQSFYGVDDLPYLYSVCDLNILVRKASPAVTSGTAVITVPGSNTAFIPPEDPGLVASIQVPTIWNPHSQSQVQVDPALRPAQLRICTSIYSISSPFTLATSPGSFTYKTTPKAVLPAVVSNTSSILTAPWGIGSYDSTKGCIQMPGSQATGNTALLFGYDSTLYREPTPLVRPGMPVGSGLALDTGNAMMTSGSNTWSNGIPEFGTGFNYIGFYVGNFPQQWKVFSSGTTTTYTANCTASAESSYFGQTISLEYLAGNTWIPYVQTLVPHGSRSPQVVPYDYVANSAINELRSALEALGGNSKGPTPYQGVVLWDPRSRRWAPTNNVLNGIFLDSSQTVVQTFRPSNGPSTGSSSFRLGGASQDMYIDRVWNGTANPKMVFTDGNKFIIDPDGGIRRAMGGHAPSTSPGTATTSVGLPLAPVAGNSTNTSNRPMMLHRPFRSVSELAYVFSDTPWRNLSFSTPESGFAPLLDIFCISNSVDPSPLVAGKVDLNTRQAPVLKAILAGVCRDELNSVLLTGSEAGAIADALIARTEDTSSTTGKGPLLNISTLVGRYGAGFSNGAAATAASQPYDGFSKDLGGLYSGGSTSANNIVGRFRESAMRALSDTGQVGTWNFLIDLVAQVGRYPTSARTPQEFLVEGEKRYWLHLAIDRQTGEVIDRQIELVNE